MNWGWSLGKKKEKNFSALLWKLRKILFHALSHWTSTNQTHQHNIQIRKQIYSTHWHCAICQKANNTLLHTCVRYHFPHHRLRQPQTTDRIVPAPLVISAHVIAHPHSTRGVIHPTAKLLTVAAVSLSRLTLWQLPSIQVTTETNRPACRAARRYFRIRFS